MASNFRIILFISFSLIFVSCAEEKIEYHHIFPQQFKNQFEMAGINVDDYTIPITKEQHKEITHKFKLNNKWFEFFKKNPQLSRKDILKQGMLLTSESGIKSGEFYEYKKRIPTGKAFSSRFGIMSGFRAKVFLYVVPIMRAITFRSITESDKNKLLAIALVLLIGGTIAIYLYFGWFIALIYFSSNLLLIFIGFKVEKAVFLLAISIVINFVLSLSLLIPLWISIILTVLLIGFLAYSVLSG